MSVGDRELTKEILQEKREEKEDEDKGKLSVEGIE